MDSLCPSHRDLISHYKCSHLEGKLMISFINNINNDPEVARPQSGSLSTWFLVKLEFGSPNIGFYGEGKTRVPREKPLVANQRTNKKLNPHRHWCWDLDLDHIGGRWGLSPLRHPLLPSFKEQIPQDALKLTLLF